MAIGTILGAAIPAAAGIAQAVAGTRKTKYDKQNLEEIAALERLKEGPGFGLSGQEERLRQQRGTVPLQQAAARARSRAEQLMAAQGTGASSADLAGLRQAGLQQEAAGRQQVEQSIIEADIQRANEQRNELEQRRANEAQRKADQRAAILGAFSQAAGAAGQVAGGTPEELRAFGLFGTPLKDPERLRAALQEQGIDEQTVDRLMARPDLARRMLEAVQAEAEGGSIDPTVGDIRSPVDL